MNDQEEQEKRDPDLERIKELWPQLTKYQRKMIYWRFRFCLFMIRIRRIPLRWFLWQARSASR